MKGTFSRISPAAFSERTGIPDAWFVISWRWMPEKSDRRRQHGKWYRIKSTNSTVYRVLRFSTHLPGSESQEVGDIVLDWPGWLELNGFAENVDDSLELKIEPASWWVYPKCALAHPDPTHRLAAELALVSVALGAISLVLGVVALCS